MNNTVHRKHEIRQIVQRLFFKLNTSTTNPEFLVCTNSFDIIFFKGLKLALYVKRNSYENQQLLQNKRN